VRRRLETDPLFRRVVFEKTGWYVLIHGQPAGFPAEVAICDQASEDYQARLPDTRLAWALLQQPALLAQMEEDLGATISCEPLQSTLGPLLQAAQLPPESPKEASTPGRETPRPATPEAGTAPEEAPVQQTRPPAPPPEALIEIVTDVAGLELLTVVQSNWPALCARVREHRALSTALTALRPVEVRDRALVLQGPQFMFAMVQGHPQFPVVQEILKEHFGIQAMRFQADRPGEGQTHGDGNGERAVAGRRPAH